MAVPHRVPSHTGPGHAGVGLVVGGTGMLAGAVADLAARGWTLLVPGRRPRRVAGTWFRADWSDPEGFAAQVALHAAAPLDLLVAWVHELHLAVHGRPRGRHAVAVGVASMRIGPSRYLATQAPTNGRLGLYRVDIGPEQAGPGPHFHRTMSEAFFLLSGALRFFDGDQWIDGTSGDFFYVPEGGVHAFRNESGQPVSMLMLFTPGAPRAAYFEAPPRQLLSSGTRSDL